MHHTTFFLRVGLFLGFVLLLTACQIEGGVRDRTPVVPNTTPDAILAPTNQSVADALAQRNDVWLPCIQRQQAALTYDAPEMLSTAKYSTLRAWRT